MTESASVVYAARHAALDGAYRRALRRAGLLHQAVTVMVIASVMAVIQGVRGELPFVVAGAALVGLAVAGWGSLRAGSIRDRLLRRVLHYDAAVERVTGVKTQSGNTGEAFRRADHVYEFDLSILGPNSLFGALDTVRTGVGQRGLADLLLNADRFTSRETVLERRAAVQELAPANDLRESIAMLGASRFQQVSAAFLDGWLEAVPPVFAPWIRICLFATSGTLVTLALLGLAGVLPWAALRTVIFLVFAVQGSIAWSVRERVRPLLEKTPNLANQMELFRDGVALLQKQELGAARLKELQAMSATPSGAVELLGQIHTQFTVVEQRTKEWFLIPSLVLCAGTHAALSISKWKLRNAAAMKVWMAAWAEFEALNALATFAYEHPAYTYPEVLQDGSAVFEAEGLAHPLLGPEAVANDIALNERTRLYLISGSNMAGKSTLMRSIGMNAVLALAGAPVRATAARISPLVVGASIALTDSLAEGRSKFLAEVERLHAVLQMARGEGSSQRVLFLIDEIFSGTNSLDRKVAAGAVAHALVRCGAIGALSTHDLTLTEMAESAELCAVNVHMASPDAADPLAFDYRLKAGVNVSSNALAILRMMGIEV